MVYHMHAYDVYDNMNVAGVPPRGDARRPVRGSQGAPLVQESDGALRRAARLAARGAGGAQPPLLLTPAHTFYRVWHR